MKKIIVVLILVFSSSLYALDLQRAYVFSEKDDGDNTKCGISYNAATSAVEAELRQNRIVIGSDKSDYIFYVNNLALSYGESCAVNVSLEAYYFASVPLPSIKNKKIFGQVSLCHEGTILSGPTYSLQNRINDSLKSMTDQCISRIEKK